MEEIGAPVVVCNLKISKKSPLANLTIKKSVVLVRNEKKIGIIGVGVSDVVSML